MSRTVKKGCERTRTQRNRRTKLDKDIAFRLRLLGIRVLRAERGTISFPVRVKLARLHSKRSPRSPCATMRYLLLQELSVFLLNVGIL